MGTKAKIERCLAEKMRNASNGLWICVLLPIALLSGMKRFAAYSELYTIISLVSVGQILSSGCDILSVITSGNNDNPVPYVEIGYLLSSTVVSLLLVFLTDIGVIFSLTAAVSTSFAYRWIHRRLIRSCPKSFTYGESTLVSQSLVLFLCSLVSNIILSCLNGLKNCEQIATVVVQAVHYSVLFTLVLAYQFSGVMKNVFVFLPVLLFVGFTNVVIIPFILLDVNVLIWLFNLCTNVKSLILIGFWVFCISGVVFYLLKQVNEQKPVTTANRKSFHYLLFLALIPGLAVNSCLMYTATGIAFALMVVVEMCRKLQLSNLSDGLQICFDTFKDEKDEGDLALTPLYLMIGCVAPIWIFPFSLDVPLPLPVLSGIFPIAIGDATASLGGMWFGRHRWKGSNKTVEGSVCCFLSQIVIFLFFMSIGVIKSENLEWACFVFLFTTLVEAKTDQIDNLILPFITYILFMIVY